MPYNSRAIGVAVARERVRRSYSQDHLSALAGISRSHLAMLENGRKTARIDTLWHIAEALEMRPSALLRAAEEIAEAQREPEL